MDTNDVRSPTGETAPAANSPKQTAAAPARTQDWRYRSVRPSRAGSGQHLSRGSARPTDRPGGAGEARRGASATCSDPTGGTAATAEHCPRWSRSKGARSAPSAAGPVKARPRCSTPRPTTTPRSRSSSSAGSMNTVRMNGRGGRPPRSSTVDGGGRRPRSGRRRRTRSVRPSSALLPVLIPWKCPLGQSDGRRRSPPAQPPNRGIGPMLL